MNASCGYSFHSSPSRPSATLPRQCSLMAARAPKRSSSAISFCDVTDSSEDEDDVTYTPPSNYSEAMKMDQSALRVEGRGGMTGVGGVSRAYEGGASSYNQRGEWMTLSKAVLMQLIERICKLSFQSVSSELNSASTSLGLSVNNRESTENCDTSIYSSFLFENSAQARTQEKQTPAGPRQGHSTSPPSRRHRIVRPWSSDQPVSVDSPPLPESPRRVHHHAPPSPKFLRQTSLPVTTEPATEMIIKVEKEDTSSQSVMTLQSQAEESRAACCSEEHSVEQSEESGVVRSSAEPVGVDSAEKFRTWTSVGHHGVLNYGRSDGGAGCNRKRDSERMRRRSDDLVTYEVGRKLSSESISSDSRSGLSSTGTRTNPNSPTHRPIRNSVTNPPPNRASALYTVASILASQSFESTPRERITDQSQRRCTASVEPMISSAPDLKVHNSTSYLNYSNRNADAFIDDETNKNMETESLVPSEKFSNTSSYGIRRPTAKQLNIQNNLNDRTASGMASSRTKSSARRNKITDNNNEVSSSNLQCYQSGVSSDVSEYLNNARRTKSTIVPLYITNGDTLGDLLADDPNVPVNNNTLLQNLPSQSFSSGSKRNGVDADLILKTDKNDANNGYHSRAFETIQSADGDSFKNFHFIGSNLNTFPIVATEMLQLLRSRYIGSLKVANYQTKSQQNHPKSRPLSRRHHNALLRGFHLKKSEASGAECKAENSSEPWVALSKNMIYNMIDLALNAGVANRLNESSKFVKDGDESKNDKPGDKICPISSDECGSDSDVDVGSDTETLKENNSDDIKLGLENLNAENCIDTGDINLNENLKSKMIESLDIKEEQKSHSTLASLLAEDIQTCSVKNSRNLMRGTHPLPQSLDEAQPPSLFQRSHDHLEKATGQYQPSPGRCQRRKSQRVRQPRRGRMREMSRLMLERNEGVEVSGIMKVDMGERDDCAQRVGRGSVMRRDDIRVTEGNRRWIALDKKQIALVIESLVESMMKIESSSSPGPASAILKQQTSMNHSGDGDTLHNFHSPDVATSNNIQQNLFITNSQDVDSDIQQNVTQATEDGLKCSENLEKSKLKLKWKSNMLHRLASGENKDDKSDECKESATL